MFLRAPPPRTSCRRTLRESLWLCWDSAPVTHVARSLVQGDVRATPGAPAGPVGGDAEPAAAMSPVWLSVLTGDEELFKLC